MEDVAELLALGKEEVKNMYEAAEEEVPHSV